VQPADRPEIEGEIRDFVRHDAARKSADDHRALAADGIADTVQCVVGTSVGEVERLIAELTRVRDHLQSEGQRVEGEIAAFAQMGEAAMQSIKEIGQSLGRFRRASGLNEIR
jgi:hypothetical protein